MEDKLNCSQLVKQLLFIEEPDLYPEEIWSYFTEALYLFLSDEDIRILECKYGTGDYDLKESFVRKRMIEISGEIYQAPIFSEMLKTIEMIEANNFEIPDFVDLSDSSYEESPDSAPFTFAERGGDDMITTPLVIDEFAFESMIEGNPVYVWKLSELSLPVFLLERILESVLSAGFEQLFLSIPQELMCEIPKGSIDKITVLPKFDVNQNLIDKNESQFAH